MPQKSRELPSRFTVPIQRSKTLGMLHAGVPVWSVLGLVALILLSWFVLHSRESAVDRRRRKSHNRVVTKSSRPMVKFSVRTPKDKK